MSVVVIIYLAFLEGYSEILSWKFVIHYSHGERFLIVECHAVWHICLYFVPQAADCIASYMRKYDCHIAIAYCLQCTSQQILALQQQTVVYVSHHNKAVGYVGR